MDLGAWILEITRSAPWPPLVALLVGGLASIGPCPLTTNLVAVSYTARQFTDRRAVIAVAVLYALGRAAGYGVIGGLVLAAGAEIRLLASGLQDVGEIALGPVLILAGLVLLEVIPLNLNPNIGWLSPLRERAAEWPGLGAFFLGFLFALAFCPYSAAIFFGVLLPLAFSAPEGWLLPSIFGLGTSAPVLVLGVPLALGIERAAAGLNRLEQFERVTRRLAALAFILAGMYILGRFILGV